MNAIKFSTLLALALALAVTGCKHKTPSVTDLGHANAGVTGNSGDNLGNSGTLTPPGPVETGGGETAPFNPEDMSQDRSTLAPQTIYFAYDSSTIGGSDHSKIEAVASALRSDSSAKLLVEGDCDERGTEEYNRSLGERRALAAREALAGAGIDPARVATRSYGEDKPAVSGHNEAAWSKNRRDEFVLLHPR